ncbi:MAG: hypothetical protein ACU843_12855 [Gammaproteobacteria bacterium]
MAVAAHPPGRNGEREVRERKDMKYWISKYALTSGIVEVESDPPKAEFGNSIFPKGYCSSFRIGKDAHEKLEEAVKKAEEMRLKKISSLRKQIEKLEKMRF